MFRYLSLFYSLLLVVQHAISQSTNDLQVSVYLTDFEPFTVHRNITACQWSQISSTLVYDGTEAVLVDVPITSAQAHAVADWIEETAPGRTLKYIYVTHGHGDHFLGLPVMLQRFPDVTAVATPGTVARMQDTLQPAAYDTAWGAWFGERVPRGQVLAQALPVNGTFAINEHEFHAVEVGMSDTYNSTVLWQPELKLAVCGDVVYGDFHQALIEANTPSLLREWISAVGKVTALGPQLVVAGHQSSQDLAGPWHLTETAKYLEDAIRLIDQGFSLPAQVDALYLHLAKLWPERKNPGSLACLFP